MEIGCTSETSHFLGVLRDLSPFIGVLRDLSLFRSITRPLTFFRSITRPLTFLGVLRGEQKKRGSVDTGSKNPRETEVSSIYAL